MGVVFCHIVLNIGVVGVSYVFTGLCMSSRDSNIIGVSTMYFISAYEFLFHVLRWGAAYLELGKFK